MKKHTFPDHQSELSPILQRMEQLEVKHFSKTQQYFAQVKRVYDKLLQETKDVSANPETQDGIVDITVEDRRMTFMKKYTIGPNDYDPIASRFIYGEEAPRDLIVIFAQTGPLGDGGQRTIVPRAFISEYGISDYYTKGLPEDPYRHFVRALSEFAGVEWDE